MFNNFSEEQIIKHFELDSGDVENMIKMWVHLNPNDNPVPITKYSIKINDKLGEVNNNTFLNLLKMKIVKTLYWQDKHSQRTQVLLVEKPLDYLIEISEKFLDSPETGLKKILTLEEENPKPPKQKKKKET